MIAFVAGLVFAAGLGLSGMTDPSRIAAFLDVTGAWDPSLALVMVGGIGVYAIAWRAIRGRGPVWASGFETPSRSGVDVRLVLGASIFGLGWGLSGVCPGPGVVGISTFDPSWVGFGLAVVLGMWLWHATASMRVENPVRGADA